MPTFGEKKILFYFVGREGYVRIGVCGNAPHTVLLCYMYYGQVDHQLLNDNVGNHHHTRNIFK